MATQKKPAPDEPAEQGEQSSPTRLALNTTDGPVVIDAKGHVLEGGASDQVHPHADAVQAAVRSGRLIYPDDHLAAIAAPQDQE